LPSSLLAQAVPALSITPVSPSLDGVHAVAARFRPPPSRAKLEGKG